MAYKFQRGSAILSGALLQEGDVEIESGFSLKIGNAEMSETDLEKLDGITDGTAAASKALVLDTNRDVSGVHAFTLSGSASGQQQSKVIFGDSENTKIERIHDSGDELVRFISSDAGIDISGSHDLGVAIYGGDGEDAGVVIEGANGLVLKNAAGNAAAVDLAQDGSISGSGILEMGGAVRLDGAGDATLNVAQDSFYFFDLTNNLMKRDTMTDYATAIAGDGLAASSGVLSVGVDDTGIEINSDALRLKDDGVTNAKLANIARGSIKVGGASDAPTDLDAKTSGQILVGDGTDIVSVAVSGDATLAANGALTIAADAVESGMLNDNVISGQTELAADGLAAADELLISDGGTLKKIGVDNLFLDGPGLLAEAAVAVADDYIMFLDGGATGDAKKESVADLATAFAGDGLVASSGVLAVQVSGAAVIHSDKVGITGSIAGDGLTFAGSKDHISGLSLDLSEYSTVQVASGDKFLMLDSDGATEQMETVDSLVEFMAGDGLAHSSGVLSLDLNELSAAAVDVANDSIAIIDANDSNGSKKESVADLMTAIAGTGIKAASGVLALDAQELSEAAVASGDYFVFEDATDNSTKKESVDDLATLFAGTGLAAASAVLSLDLNELSAAAVDVSADSIAIIDANDSNGTRKESIADLVSAMAGSGLTAANGQLSTQGSTVALKADGETLAEGYNYFAQLSGSNVGVDLPAAPTVGDVIHVKLGNVLNDKILRITPYANHTIDGESTIDLESPYAAVSLVYVVSGSWRIV